MDDDRFLEGSADIGGGNSDGVNAVSICSLVALLTG
jgi:hypothetical protein